LLDLYLLPINLNAGQEENELPGLLVAEPPRRMERIRTGDQLLILLSFPGSTSLSPNHLIEAQERLAKLYFTTRGAVTSGLRAAAEDLNNSLLTRNLRDREGKQSVAVLQMAVIHKDVLYLAQAGIGHAFVLSAEGLVHYSGADTGTRGVGVGRNYNLRLYQASLLPGDRLVLCPNPPETWSDATFSGNLQSIELLRRHLLSPEVMGPTGVDLEALLVQFQAGPGKVHRLRPRSMGASEPLNSGQASTPAPARPANRPARIFGQGVRPLEQAPEPGKASLPAEQPLEPARPAPRPFGMAARPVEPPVVAQEPVIQPPAADSVPTNFQPAETAKPTALEDAGDTATHDGIFLSGRRLRTDAAGPQTSEPAQVGPDRTGLGPQEQPAGTGEAQKKKPLFLLLFQKKEKPAKRPQADQPLVAPGRRAPSAAQPDPAVPAPVQPVAASQPGPELQTPRSPAPERTAVFSSPQPAVRASTAPEPPPAATTQPQAAAKPLLTAKPLLNAQPSQPTASPRPQTKPNVTLRRRLLKIWRGGKTATQAIDRSGKILADRMLPGTPDQPSMLSSTNMLFLAIAVPLVVVAVSVTMYIYAPGGRSQQHLDYLEKAQTYATQAASQADAALHRATLSESVQMLNEADRYGSSEDSQALRDSVQTELDQIDGVQRMAPRPAVPGGFASTVNISRILVTPTEMYLLDKTQGRVLRAVLSGKEYEVDPKFHCSPGLSGGLNISPLIDVVIPPPNNRFNATALALDQSGDIVYCQPGDYPSSQALPVPDTGWGEIRAFTYDQGVLYVLDVTNNRIWLFVAGEDLTFGQPPHLYFNNQVPVLNDVLDMKVYNDDLFLLHGDGKITRCTFRSSPATNTRCDDPFPYNDPRVGRGNKTVQIPEANFTQIQLTQPFEPSIYMLDAANKSIYQFSMQLNLHRLLRADSTGSYPLPDKPLTAFAVTTDLHVLVAFQNEVYSAALPQ
jgi:hypothetical protein